MKRPTIVAIDDVMSSRKPDELHARLREKLLRFAEAAGCDILFPGKKAEVFACPTPALVILDIDLKGWRPGLTGYKIWDEIKAKLKYREWLKAPIIVLSKESHKGSLGGTGTKFFSQGRTARVEWIDKLEFIEGDEELLSNRVRSMATDVDNSAYSIALSLSPRVLKIRRDAEEIGAYHFPESAGGMFLFEFIKRILKNGNVVCSYPRKGEEGYDEYLNHKNKIHDTIGTFNKVIVELTKGLIGYKLLVNQKDPNASGWVLRVGKCDPLPPEVEKPPEKRSLEKDVDDLRGRLEALERRIVVLERKGNFPRVISKGKLA